MIESWICWEIFGAKNIKFDEKKVNRRFFCHKCLNYGSDDKRCDKETQGEDDIGKEVERRMLSFCLLLFLIVNQILIFPDGTFS